MVGKGLWSYMVGKGLWSYMVGKGLWSYIWLAKGYGQLIGKYILRLFRQLTFLALSSEALRPDECQSHRQSPTGITGLTRLSCTTTGNYSNTGAWTQTLTFLHWSKSFTVIFPVPGPTSRTTSVERRAAWRGGREGGREECEHTCKRDGMCACMCMRQDRQTFSTMLLMTRGFFRMCCPLSFSNMIPEDG